MDDRLLGLPLERALRLLREEGVTPTVTRTEAPGDRRPEGGTWRVVRVKGTELTVARFLDGLPRHAPQED